MTIPVVVIEDNDELREGLTELLKRSAGFLSIGGFGSCEDFLAVLDPKLRVIVLMDIGLPGMSGIEGVRQIRSRAPDAEVMMLTVYEDDQKIMEALCAGASGYLLKKTPPHQLIKAVRELYNGGAPMTPAIARRVLALFPRVAPVETKEYGLSAREREVLDALVRGLSYKMIADAHSISIDTVRTHIKHIYEKLHVNSKAQAITLAMRSRLV